MCKIELLKKRLVSSHLSEFAYEQCEQKPEKGGHHTGTGERGNFQKWGLWRTYTKQITLSFPCCLPPPSLTFQMGAVCFRHNGSILLIKPPLYWLFLSPGRKHTGKRWEVGRVLPEGNKNGRQLPSWLIRKQQHARAQTAAPICSPEHVHHSCRRGCVHHYETAFWRSESITVCHTTLLCDTHQIKLIMNTFSLWRLPLTHIWAELSADPLSLVARHMYRPWSSPVIRSIWSVPSSAITIPEDCHSKFKQKNNNSFAYLLYSLFLFIN